MDNEKTLNGHLYDLETTLLRAETRKSREQLDELLAPDFMEISSTGNVFDKANVLDRLPKENDPGITCRNFEMRELSSTTALTTFEIFIESKGQHSLRSSVWRRTYGKWQMCFHQGTVTEAKDEEEESMTFESYLKSLPDFETSRLRLRKLKFSDVNDVYEFCSNPKVAYPMTWETNASPDVTREFLTAAISGYETGESGEWAVEWKDTGKVIGVAAFIDWSNLHKSIELGYFLSEEYWGKGVATEALEKLVSYGLHELKANRIEGRCDTDNFGSQRVMEKVGMVYEGTLRKNEYIKGEFRDTQVYALLNHDYQLSQ
ncbi:GNAT family N-acetyltransferase [Halobacillus litoralis]|uniref:GNAT family N-acetyltransferase n=1 Tax=Halobacillus litoralis TaxID=45668 RepID=UPI001CFD4A3B|nr:GNAT family N-acetyltransferase [Halobacillus litoralis]